MKREDVKREDVTERERLGGDASPHQGKPAPLVTTIKWTRVADGLPEYGVAVAVWIPATKQVLRAFRDLLNEDAWCWRVSRSLGPRIQADLVVAWTPIPNGVLPPPDQGGAV